MMVGCASGNYSYPFAHWEVENLTNALLRISLRIEASGLNAYKTEPSFTLLPPELHELRWTQLA